MVGRVAADPDFGQKIKDAEITEQKLREYLRPFEADIWASVSQAVSDYNSEEKKSAGLQLAFQSMKDNKPLYLRTTEDILPALLGFLFLSLFSLFSGAVRHFLFLFFVSLRAVPVFVALGLVLFMSLVTWAANRGKAKVYHANLKAAEQEYETSKVGLPKKLAEIEPALISSIQSHLRVLLEQVSRPPFRLDLPDTDTAGLSEVHNHEFEIITDARRAVRGLIEKMSGGSIGIAGPRGCGKTTLLQSFWREGEVDPDKLSILATAPVRYDSREFLLHLFTSLCSHVIAKETKADVPPAWTQMDGLRKAAAPRFLDTGVVASLFLIAGIILLTTAFAFGVSGQSNTPRPSTSKTPSSSSQPSNQKSASPGSIVPPSPPAPTPASPEDTSSQLAIPYLIWGVVALIVGTLTRFSPGQPMPTGPGDFFLSPWVPEFRRRKAEEADEQERLTRIDPKVLPLVQRAQRTLLGLRFQQSYSSGWSGTLKLPIGLEGGANAAVNFAETQLSLPEVVNEYRDFLKEASKRYKQILVSIDELDKLASDDDARTFLNSIKAIFGQEKVYYLVSISENAISNFERRGLPIRDEFDSSFDDAIYIGYLDFAASCRLLARRVVEPPPYVHRAFCHAMSGGLPRDLIRYCRKLYDYRRANLREINSAAVTCPALVLQDIRAKLEATRHNLQRVSDEKKAADILTLISVQTWDQKALREAIVKLGGFQASFESEAASKNQIKEDSGADLLELARIVEETKAYLCFSLVVSDTFATITTEARNNELEAKRVFDSLALARQWMSVNRAAAIATITRVGSLPIPTSEGISADCEEVAPPAGN
jgi:hypothetical protein